MSILNRPGWANRPIINEGRLHSDDLKQRITNLFQRTSLGNSPTYTVGKIAEILRRENGEDIEINEITDEDIIRISNLKDVTNGKFTPKLKDSIASSRQDQQNSTPSSDIEVDNSFDQNEFTNDADDSFDISSDIEDLSDPDNELEFVGATTSTPEFDSQTNELEFSGTVSSEDAEEAEKHIEKKKNSSCSCGKTQRPHDEPKMNEIIKKESVKLSPKAVNELLRENYIKSKQHKFRIEERYRF